MQLCSKEQCTGCLACKNSCPQNAINIKTDELEKIYTVIDSRKCVECGICRTVCHIINPPVLKNLRMPMLLGVKYTGQIFFFGRDGSNIK